MVLFKFQNLLVRDLIEELIVGIFILHPLLRQLNLLEDELELDIELLHDIFDVQLLLVAIVFEALI